MLCNNWSNTNLFLLAISVSIIFPVQFIHGLLFGSIAASIDAVAVAAVFKRFSVSKKLNLIIEGESLLNDSTSIVSFNVLKGIIFSNIAFSLIGTSFSFLWSMLGAVALGSAIGYIGGKILNKWQGDEYVISHFQLP
ncbi:MAG: hypothetical protein DLM72_05450 [Candidatus Nitrosopolaris wilkensis]|nr:MAG: hypothetical protein DLM72_05450 [Candidatus Nitrosopolaris wilkensis]